MSPNDDGVTTLFRKVSTSPQFVNGTPEDRINALLALDVPEDVRFLSQFLAKDVKLTSFARNPTTASARFTFKVDRFYCNYSGNLHGGAQATIYDVLTSLALQAIGTSDFWLNAGVSRSLNVTYLRPAPAGILVECDVEVMHAGKSLSLLRGVMRRQDDGKIISTCEHDKAAVLVKAGFDVPAPAKL